MKSNKKWFLGCLFVIAIAATSFFAINYKSGFTYNPRFEPTNEVSPWLIDYPFLGIKLGDNIANLPQDYKFLISSSSSEGRYRIKLPFEEIDETIITLYDNKYIETISFSFTDSKNINFSDYDSISTKLIKDIIKGDVAIRMKSLGEPSDYPFLSDTSEKVRWEEKKRTSHSETIDKNREIVKSHLACSLEGSEINRYSITKDGREVWVSIFGAEPSKKYPDGRLVFIYNHYEMHKSIEGK